MTKKLSYDELPEVVRTGMSKKAWDAYQPGAADNVLVPNIRDAKGGMDLFSSLVEKRVLRLDGQVDDAMAAVFVSALFLLAEKDPNSEITVMINSPGGSVIAGLAMYDAMRSCPAPITTVVSGMAASMGSILLCAGDKRAATPNARVMIHQPSGGGRGTATDTDTNQQLINDMWDQLTQIYVDHSGVPHEMWDELLQKGDIWLKPGQAKDLALIDGVLPAAKQAPFAGMQRNSVRKHFNESVPAVIERAKQIRQGGNAPANDDQQSKPAKKSAGGQAPK